MIWIFAIVAVVLVTIIVQLLLVYQKRAHDLRMRPEPLRRHIRHTAPVYLAIFPRFYTRRLFGGRHPLWGMGVTSLMPVI